MSSFGFLGFVVSAVNAVVNVANNINNNNNNRKVLYEIGPPIHVPNHAFPGTTITMTTTTTK